jgi:hypothetical protein
MKILILLMTILLVDLPVKNCNGEKKEKSLYKGRLEIKALCMNYTLKLLEGDLDTFNLSANWTDESTGKSYTRVFGLANPCDFPSSIKQGDEFYFLIDTVKEKNCAVCMAYYPTPPRKLIIKVVNK